MCTDCKKDGKIERNMDRFEIRTEEFERILDRFEKKDGRV